MVLKNGLESVSITILATEQEEPLAVHTDVTENAYITFRLPAVLDTVQQLRVYMSANGNSGPVNVSIRTVE